MVAMFWMRMHGVAHGGWRWMDDDNRKEDNKRGRGGPLFDIRG
eukprot:CAMPEP_0201603046 /NCGR_PEP_ID=MMETSP0492-20130828/3614_1 /ASSEMBLY_ACC=CAM_ASM_000837 /TAXON_ID=420259 /ORGANISM="Thalassiosira gravida, Strain GMp14c1" /LENGTH=42 /DNA_ID= /DNA_START= /DNA_END= /DNA_ORIENTATION=